MLPKIDELFKQLNKPCTIRNQKNLTNTDLVIKEEPILNMFQSTI